MRFGIVSDGLKAFPGMGAIDRETVAHKVKRSEIAVTGVDGHEKMDDRCGKIK